MSNNNDYYMNCITSDIKYLNNKDRLLSDYVRYYMNRLCSMFSYENLPEEIPAKFIDLYTMSNGCSVFFKHNDKYYVTFGGLSGEPDAYYRPTKFTVANPGLRYYGTLELDVNSVLIKNDATLTGLKPLLSRYCSLMVENVITMKMEIINNRIPFIIGASDDKTKASAELFVKKIIDGEISIIGENSFFDGVKFLPNTANSKLTDLIEEQQYLKASLYNELGLNANYNMKREAINSNESQLNDDMLKPLIDDMLTERKIAFDKINEIFGLNVEVKYNSAWLDNEIEHDVMIDNLTAEEANDEAAENDEAENEEADEDKKDVEN